MRGTALTEVKAALLAAWLNTAMDKTSAQSLITYRDECLAYRAGACTARPQCLACGPVHQALRVASIAVARWPRPLRRQPGAQ